MTSLINYVLEANIALMIFLGVYYLLLARETNFKVMRFFLLSSIVSALVLPLLQFNVSGNATAVNQFVRAIMLPEFTIVDGHTDSSGDDWTAWQVMGILYLAVLCFLAVRFVMEIMSLIRLLAKSKTYRHERFSVAESDDDRPTFSFFNFIYVGNSKTLSALEKKQIIEHESVHARQLHSIDILIVRVLQIAFWFNPLIGFYKRNFIRLHEFEADARAVENSDANKYCNLLAKVALQSADYSFANHFNNSLTLKRITMIRTIKRRINQWRLMSAIFTIPLMAFVLGFHEQAIAQKQVPASASNEVYTEVDELPKYGNGFDDLVSFLSQNMKYPKEAKDKKIEGTVFTEFIVEKNGELSEIKIKQGIGSGCDDEALRVVKAMPKWTPGVHQGKAVRTKMVLPLKFKLG